MNSSSSIYLRSRHREASKKDRILDVTNLDNNGNGTKIVPESTLTKDHIKSSKYYIASKNQSNFDKAFNVLNTESSRVKTPVPRKPLQRKTPYIPPEIVGIILKYLPQKDLQEMTKVSRKFKNLSNYEITKDRTVIVRNLDSVPDHIRLKIKKMKYTGPASNICSLSKFPNLEYLEDASVNNNDFIIEASSLGCLEVVKFLHKLPSVNSEDYSYSVVMASYNNHLDVIKYLVSQPNVDPSTNDNEAIEAAVRNGYIDVVKFLRTLPSVVNGLWYDDIIIQAAQGGQIEMVKYLMETMDIAINNNEAFIDASRNGKLSMVKFLAGLDAVNVNAQENEAIVQASENGYIDVVKFLINLLPNLPDQSLINRSISRAMYSDDAEVVKYLFGFLDDPNKYLTNKFLEEAIDRRNVEVIKFLTPLLNSDF
ncbi:MAG: ankyrin repeat domain-containing protein [Candidatus Marithrix sp.]